MALGSRFEAAGNAGGGGADLVGSEALQDLPPAPEDALVRAEELVGRADQEVAAERLHVDRDMRGQLHGVDVGEGSGGARPGTDGFDVVDGAGQVAGAARADKTGAVG